MTSIPTEERLQTTLAAAGRAHHDYQSDFLGGAPDKQWAGWYSAYVLGRLGDFTTPTLLTRWLQDVSSDADWLKDAAAHVLSKVTAT